MNDLIVIQDTRPTRADAVKNRELLLDTARRLFDERGVNEVSMNALAEAAGVGKGTLYRHFPSKAQLCEVLIDADQFSLQERTLSRLREGGDARDHLRWFLGEVFGFIERNEPLLMDVSARESIVSHVAHHWWHQTIRGLLGRMTIRPDLDLDAAADMLYLMLNPRMIGFQRQLHGWTYARVLAGMLNVVDAWR